MAATTSGWQCPVEQTAMPEEKSRNSLPSTSSIMQPRPRRTTSGYERVYDGEIISVSRRTMLSALGPGSLPLTCGRPLKASEFLAREMGLVAMALSCCGEFQSYGQARPVKATHSESG